MKKFILSLILLLSILVPNTTYAVEPIATNDGDGINYLSISNSDFERIRAIAEQQDLNRLKSKVYIDNPLGTVFSGVGRVVYDLGNNTKQIRGTGFIIDDHTILTNAHVADKEGATKKFEKPDVSKLQFQPAVQYGKAKYTFHAVDLTFISNTDIAIIHTKEKMTNSDIRTMKIASEEEVKNMKSGDRIHIAGYPQYPENMKLDKMYWSQGIFLGTAPNNASPNSTVDTMVSLESAYTTGGNSGSPVMNSNYKVIGVHAIAYNSDTDLALDKLQITGGGLIDGYIRNTILKYMK